MNNNRNYPVNEPRSRRCCWRSARSHGS